MSQPKLFRTLLVAAAVFTVLSMLFTAVPVPPLPEPLAGYVAQQNATPPTGAVAWIVGLALLVSIVIFVGAFRFWPPVRPLTVASMLAALLVMPLMPPVVMSALASGLQSASLVLTGLLIGAMYWLPEVSARFERREPGLAGATA